MVVLTAAFSMEADLAAAGSRLLRSNLVEVEIDLRRTVWVSEVLLLPAVLPDSAVLLTPWLTVVPSLPAVLSDSAALLTPLRTLLLTTVASGAVPLRLQPEPSSATLASEEPWPGQLFVVQELSSVPRQQTLLSLTRLSVAVPVRLRPWPSVLETMSASGLTAAPLKPEAIAWVVASVRVTSSLPSLCPTNHQEAEI